VRSENVLLCVLVLMLLDLDTAEHEAAELKPVAAALQRLTGAQ
jgi:type IV secretory pathway VirB2 component (pilin)